MVIEAARQGKEPKFDIPVRALSNVNFNKKSRIIEMGKSKTERQFFNLGMAKKFMQTVVVAEALMELQREDGSIEPACAKFITALNAHDQKRSSSENTFDDQNESDPIIEDIEVTLALLREELKVRAGGHLGLDWSARSPSLMKAATRSTVHARRVSPAKTDAVDRGAGISRHQKLHRRLHPADRKGHSVQPSIRRQILEEAQLHSAHRQWSATSRNPAARAPASR